MWIMIGYYFLIAIQPGRMPVPTVTPTTTHALEATVTSIPTNEPHSSPIPMATVAATEIPAAVTPQPGVTPTPIAEIYQLTIGEQNLNAKGQGSVTLAQMGNFIIANQSGLGIIAQRFEGDSEFPTDVLCLPKGMVGEIGGTGQALQVRAWPMSTVDQHFHIYCD